MTHVARSFCDLMCCWRQSFVIFHWSIGTKVNTCKCNVPMWSWDSLLLPSSIWPRVLKVLYMEEPAFLREHYTAQFVISKAMLLCQTLHSLLWQLSSWVCTSFQSEWVQMRLITTKTLILVRVRVWVWVRVQVRVPECKMRHSEARRSFCSDTVVLHFGSSFGHHWSNATFN